MNTYIETLRIFKTTDMAGGEGADCADSTRRIGNTDGCAAGNNLETRLEPKDTPKNTTKDASKGTPKSVIPHFPEITIQIGDMKIKKSKPIIEQSVQQTDDNLFYEILHSNICLQPVVKYREPRRQNQMGNTILKRINHFWLLIKGTSWESSLDDIECGKKFGRRVIYSAKQFYLSSNYVKDFYEIYTSFFTLLYRHHMSILDSLNFREDERESIISHVIGMGHEFYHNMYNSPEDFRYIAENKLYADFQSIVIIPTGFFKKAPWYFGNDKAGC